MQNIDPYSYQCGVIDCFNEMVRSGVKALALSHPMDSAAERDALIPFARSCCHQYGNQLYIEDTPLLTDLFPLSLNQGKFNILFYRAGHILDQYLRLKERKAKRIFTYATYAIFTNGLESFDKAYREGVIDGVFGSNLTYRTEELKNRPWFYEVDVSKYISYFISAMNHDMSVSAMIDPHEKINALLERRQRERSLQQAPQLTF